MKVEYVTLEEFNEAIYYFVTQGLTFEAQSNMLTITFTGGY